MGSEGSRLAESERGVWFLVEKVLHLHTPFLEIESTSSCFSGARRKTVSTPKLLEPRPKREKPRSRNESIVVVLSGSTTLIGFTKTAAACSSVSWLTSARGPYAFHVRKLSAGGGCAGAGADNAATMSTT